MARPTKSSLDYFNLDCVQDDNLNFIEARHGVLGFAVVVKLWQKIYRNEGYYLPWKEINLYLFAREIGLEAEIIQQVLDSCMQPGIGIFSKELYGQYGILTSHGIQKRWLRIVKDARRRDVDILPEYNLLEEGGVIEGNLREDYGNVPENSGRNPEETTQTILNDNKVKETIKEEKEKEESAAGAATHPGGIEERKKIFFEKMVAAARAAGGEGPGVRTAGAGAASSGAPDGSVTGPPGAGSCSGAVQRMTTSARSYAAQPKYPQEMLESFFRYWTECNEKGRKMRFEMQPVFDMKLRLATWKANGERFKQRWPQVRGTTRTLFPNGCEPGQHLQGYGKL